MPSSISLLTADTMWPAASSGPITSHHSRLYQLNVRSSQPSFIKLLFSSGFCCCGKMQLGDRRGDLAYTAMSLLIREGSRQELSEAGITNQWCSLACFLLPTQDYQPRDGTPSLSLPHLWRPEKAATGRIFSRNSVSWLSNLILQNSEEQMLVTLTIWLQHQSQQTHKSNMLPFLLWNNIQTKCAEDSKHYYL